MKKTAEVISAFPGTGKTYCFNHIEDLVVLDSDSSKFDKKFFPENYIQHIKDNIGVADIIFVSSHKVVRDALWEAGIEFTLVYPDITLKEEYLDRYKKRGSPQAFIDLLEKNWDAWITEIQIERVTGRYDSVKLDKGKTIFDIVEGLVCGYFNSCWNCKHFILDEGDVFFCKLKNVWKEISEAYETTCKEKKES